jgi:MFS family permease
VSALAFLFVAAFYAIPTRLPFLLGEVDLSDPFLIGAVSSLVTLAAVPGGLGYGRLRGLASPLAIFALSWGVMGLGMGVLALAPSAGVMSAGVVLVGLGMGPAIPNHMATLMAAAPAASRGRASGLMTVALFGGQFASPLLTGPSSRPSTCAAPSRRWPWHRSRWGSCWQGQPCTRGAGQRWPDGRPRHRPATRSSSRDILAANLGASP